MSDELKFTITVTGKAHSPEATVSIKFDPALDLEDGNYADSGVGSAVVALLEALPNNPDSFEGE